MTNKEINEYLAEKLFGYSSKHGGNILSCDKGGIWCYTDYCSNAMPVLEKFAELKQPIAIDFYSTEDYGSLVSCHSVNIAVKGSTIHEAICRCAVEYLKAVNNGTN